MFLGDQWQQNATEGNGASYELGGVDKRPLEDDLNLHPNG